MLGPSVPNAVEPPCLAVQGRGAPTSILGGQTAGKSRSQVILPATSSTTLTSWQYSPLGHEVWFTRRQRFPDAPPQEQGAHP